MPTSAMAQGPGPTDQVYNATDLVWVTGHQGPGWHHFRDSRTSSPGSWHWTCVRDPDAAEAMAPGPAFPTWAGQAMASGSAAGPSQQTLPQQQMPIATQQPWQQAPQPVPHMVNVTAMTGAPPPPPPGAAAAAAMPGAMLFQAPDPKAMGMAMAAADAPAGGRTLSPAEVQAMREGGGPYFLADLLDWPEKYRTLFVGNLPTTIRSLDIVQVARDLGVRPEKVDLNEPGGKSNLRSAMVIVANADEGHHPTAAMNMAKFIRECHAHLSLAQHVSRVCVVLCVCVAFVSQCVCGCGCV